MRKERLFVQKTNKETQEIRPKPLFFSQDFIFFSFVLYAKFLLLHYFLFEEFNFLTSLLELPLGLLFFLAIEKVVAKHKRVFYYVVSSLFSLFMFSIVLYHDYYGAIITYQSLEQAGQVPEVSKSILSLFHIRYYLFFFEILFVLFFFAFRLFPLFLRRGKREKLRPKKSRNSFTKKSFPRKKGRFLAPALLSLATIGLTILFAFKENITNETILAKKIGITNYQFYVVLNTKFSHPKYSSSDITLEKIQKAKGLKPKTQPLYFGIAKNKNIIVIQIEAFQDFVIGVKLGEQEITPNLNRLIQESFYFPNFYQQIGKGNTSDAEFILNTSLYPVGNHAMSQKYSDRNIPSLPKYLRSLNYESVTFHTNSSDFWNREKLYQALGFDKYYDKTFFGNEEFIAFGASDKILFEKSIPELLKIRAKNKRIYANFITMSSHHPYEIPDKYKVYRAPEKLRGTWLGNYLESVSYADAQIGRFIELLKENRLYEDTVFVLYGDHFALREGSLSDYEKKIIEGLTGKKYNTPEEFNVPLIIRVPGLKGETLTHTGGQVDILPTIANLVGLDLKDRIYFGQDLLNYRKGNILPMRFYTPTGTFISDDVLFVPGESFDDGYALSLITHQNINKTEEHKKQYQKVFELLAMNDAYIQSLPFLKSKP